METDLKYLNPKDIRYIHDYIVAVSGGLKGELNGCLESVCHTAEAYHEEQTLEGLAAFYLARIAKGHCFNDGNKRAAYFATRFFLMLNGADFDGRDVREAANEMETIAAAENGKAYTVARELTGKYVERGQLTLTSMEQFERLVLKSIGVASILSKK